MHLKLFIPNGESTTEKKWKTPYIEKLKSKHINLRISDSGLVINTSFPNLGASPDGIITCDCCVKGCLEIKCIYIYTLLQNFQL